MESGTQVADHLHAASNVERQVISSLRREGELSLPELVELTHLPSGVVQAAAARLLDLKMVASNEQERSGLITFKLLKT